MNDAPPDRPPARWFVQLNLALLGASFAWFAYIDAPITDGAMRLFALAVLGALLSIVAALRSGEAGTTAARERSRRLASWLFLAATALMLASATLTLNLRGSDSDEEDTATKVGLHAGLLQGFHAETPAMNSSTSPLAMSKAVTSRTTGRLSPGAGHS